MREVSYEIRDEGDRVVAEVDRFEAIPACLQTIFGETIENALTIVRNDPDDGFEIRGLAWMDGPSEGVVRWTYLHRYGPRSVGEYRSIERVAGEPIRA